MVLHLMSFATDPHATVTSKQTSNPSHAVPWSASTIHLCCTKLKAALSISWMLEKELSNIPSSADTKPGPPGTTCWLTADTHWVETLWDLDRSFSFSGRWLLLKAWYWFYFYWSSEVQYFYYPQKLCDACYLGNEENVKSHITWLRS